MDTLVVTSSHNTIDTDGIDLPSLTARGDLVRRWRSQKDKLQDAIYIHVRETVPDPIVDDDAELARGLRETIAACVDCCLASIEQGERWSGTMPPLVAMQARRGASRGMDLVTALDRCVAGYSRVWTFVLGEVSRCDLPAEQRFELLSQVSRVTSLILARIQAEVADAHSSEIKRKARSREQRTNEIVHKLLREEPVDAGELLELGYELDRWHLGVIAAGAQAMSAVRALAAGLGCELLTVTHGAEAVRAWLGGPRRIAFADIERIRSMQPSLDVALAIGEPGRGIKGWRQTHHEAEGALLVARNWPRKLTRYLDVATDAMVLQDDALADALIETYLSPLDEMRIGGETARRMMRALFDAEHNVSSAASALKVDRSTVHRQRNEIERRLGCRLHERQAEIEVALRVEDLRARHHAGKMA